MSPLPAIGRPLRRLVLGCLIAVPASAATINVNTLLDSGSTSDGLCTLREAVLAADLNIAIDTCAAGSNSTADVIVLAPSLFPLPLQVGLINLVNSLDIIDNDLSIQVPANASLSLIGAGDHPILTLNQDLGASFSLNNTLIRDGVNSDDGGGIAILGGTATVNLSNVTLTNNHSDGRGGSIGIASSDPLTLNLDTVTISHSDATDGGGIGGQVGEDLTVNLTDSWLLMNTATGDGGGLYLTTPATISNIQTTVTVQSSRIVDNMAGGGGGGVMLVRGNQASNRSITTISDSRFEGNQAIAGSGGGLVAFGLRSDAFSRIELRRNSFVGNSAGQTGGAMQISVLATTLINNSVLGNTAGVSGGANISYINATAPYEMSLIGNSFSGNLGGTGTASSAAWDLSVTYPGVAGSVIRFVANIFNSAVDNPSDAACRLGTVPAAAGYLGGHNRVVTGNFASNCVVLPSDLVLPDLGLALLPVSDPVHTQAALPQPGSPLIDSWPDAACSTETALPLERDMLGLRRIGGTPLNGDPRTAAACDAGAIEAPAGALLSVSLVGTGMGTVTSTPAGIDCGLDCEAAFPLGSQINLSAGSAPGSVFVSWSGACTGSGSCVVNLNQSLAVTAQFDLLPQSHSVDVSLIGDGSGEVSSTPGGILCQPSCSADFMDGTVLTLLASPNSDSRFHGWGGDCAFAGNSPSCQLTVSADRNLSAEFGLTVDPVFEDGFE